MADAPFIKRNSEAIATGLLVCIIWAAVAYLAHIAFPWFQPLFYGLAAASAVCVAIVAVMILRRVPHPLMVPSSKNIETCVRSWLDNYKVMVKNDPFPDAHFRLRITLDGGTHLIIIRSKSDYPDYVQIVCDLGMRGDDKKFLERFTEHERTQMMFDMKLELSRAKVGYSGLIDPPEKFHIFRRVPIYPTLTEFAFMSMIGDVEAATNLVRVIFLRAKYDKDRTSTPLTLPARSEVSQLEPPVA
jgi:hypothetical protein